MEGAGHKSRNVYVFGLTSLLNDTASEMAYWILPAFLTAIGAGPATLGLIEGVAESVASLGKLFSGYLTDRMRRRKPIVVFGYAVANLLKPLLALAQVWWHVLFIRFGDRLSKGLRGAPRDVMLAESVEQAKVGSAYGLLQAMDSAGAIVGPAVALLFVGSLGLRGVFWVAAIPGLAAIVVIVLFARETGSSSPAPIAAGGASAHRDLVPSAPLQLPASYYYVLIVVALFSLGNSSDMFLVLRAQAAGIPVRHAPLLGLVFNLTYTAFSWPAGYLSDRMPKHSLVAAGYLVFAVVYAVFAAAPSTTLLWLMMAFYGLFYAFTSPVLKGVVVEQAPAEARGRAFGIFNFVTSVAALLSSILTGELWKVYGPAVPFTLSAGLALIAAILLLARGWRVKAA
ncbi:MAG TPA: MFS transporter [Terriglobales bacterium]|nr:MFS transporter [Terriglobales bacterium]